MVASSTDVYYIGQYTQVYQRSEMRSTESIPFQSSPTFFLGNILKVHALKCFTFASRAEQEHKNT